MSSATGSDIQKYHHAVMKAKNNGIDVKVTGECFLLTDAFNHGTLGKFINVNDIFQYLCGYEAGLDRGLVEGIGS